MGGMLLVLGLLVGAVSVSVCVSMCFSCSWRSCFTGCCLFCNMRKLYLNGLAVFGQAESLDKHNFLNREMEVCKVRRQSFEGIIVFSGTKVFTFKWRWFSRHFAGSCSWLVVEAFDGFSFVKNGFCE